MPFTAGSKPFPSLRGVLLLGSVLLFGLGAAAPVWAQSYQDAMARAYAENPELIASRRELLAVAETIAQARAGYFPQIDLQTNLQFREDKNNFPGGASAFNDNRPRVWYQPKQVSFNLQQLIFDGFRTDAQVERAEFAVAAQRAELTRVEQALILDASFAYLDVARDQDVVELNENNLKVLGQALQAAQDRFSVGEVTRTDVEQAQARLERARADLSQATANLQTSRASFFQLIGMQPGRLSLPPLPAPLPDSLERALELARDQNPIVSIAEFSRRAAEADVTIARSADLPQIDVSASASFADEPTSGVVERENYVLSLNGSVPIFTGGLNSARVREARRTVLQREAEIEARIREAQQQAEASWLRVESLAQSIVALEAQVRASQLAVEGVREEAVIGSRTTLDLLDAEQELLNARVELVSARRDFLASALQVLNATGTLTPETLELGILSYDPQPEIEASRNRLFGYGIE